ncbi:MAG TPA: rod-binding protein [Gemmatimonadales bacterium]
MTTPLTGRAGATPTPLTENERLRKVARDLEGVFVEQMFRAMRETVPDGGVVDGGTGEEMFTTLLDQKLSADAPARWDRGLAEAVYRQLRGRMGGEADPSSLPLSPPILSSDKRPEQP